jgi:hypothetical protein
MTGLQREDYIHAAKETLKLILIPAFVERDRIRSGG